MRLHKKLLISAAMITALGSALANPAAQSREAGLHAVRLAWAAPGKRIDGSVVHRTDIAGYRIYVGRPQSEDYAQAIDIDDPQTTRYTVRGLQSGAYRFAVTVRDVFGNESSLSKELVYNVR